MTTSQRPAPHRFKKFYRLLDRFLCGPGLILPLGKNVRARVAEFSGRAQMDPRENLYEFWRQEAPKDNVFDTPPTCKEGASIMAMFPPEIDASARIMEVGCNAGRNLHHLFHHGFQQLSAVEINPHAVAKLRKAYPDMAGVNILIGPAEEQMRSLADGAVDVVYTLAVLEHIHYESREVFDQIARVAKRYVLAIEPRNGHATHRQYPWDIEAEYTRRGLKLVKRCAWESLFKEGEAPEGAWSYDCFLFYRPGL